MPRATPNTTSLQLFSGVRLVLVRLISAPEPELEYLTDLIHGNRQDIDVYDRGVLQMQAAVPCLGDSETLAR
jgi:hypothetical protein